MGLWLRGWLTVRVCALRSRNIIAGRTCAVDECEVQWWYREMFVMLCVILLFFLPDILMRLWKLQELLAADCVVEAQQWASWLVNQRWIKKKKRTTVAPMSLPRWAWMSSEKIYSFTKLWSYSFGFFYILFYPFTLFKSLPGFNCLVDWTATFWSEDGLAVMRAEFKCVKVQSGLKWNIILGAFDNTWRKYIIWTPIVILRNHVHVQVFVLFSLIEVTWVT